MSGTSARGKEIKIRTGEGRWDGSGGGSNLQKEKEYNK